MKSEHRKTERTYGQWWESPSELVEVPIAALRQVALAGLESAGCDRADSEFIFASLLDKALQGDPVRGFGILAGLVRAAREGHIELRPKITLVRETASTALIEASARANSSVVCRHAVRLGMEKAKTTGAAWIGVKSWPSSFAPLMKMAANEDLVAIALDASIPNVAPWGATTPMLGNAPVGFGIPAGQHAPVIVDMSITNSSSTPVALAPSWGNPTLPEGFILNEKGEPSTDARDYIFKNWSLADSTASGYNVRGSLMPLGSAVSAHKGYALLFAVNVLATALSDTDYPWNKKPGGPEIQFGCQFIVVDPSAFLPIDKFKKHVDMFIEQAKNAPLRAGFEAVLYPGERSQQLQEAGLRRGTAKIPIEHFQELKSLSLDLGLHGVFA